MLVLRRTISKECSTWKGTSNLTKVGFFAGSIERISKNSRIKKKEAIIRVLCNTQRCFGPLLKIVRRETCVSHEAICEIHRLLLHDDNINANAFDGNIRFELICR
jgi:hypothetical protein